MKLEYLIKVKELTGLKIVTELMDWEQVQKYKDHIDIIQIGSRNMYNYDLLSKLGTINNTILLKRGFSATIEEWLNAAEYIAMNGNQNIILCERGIRTFEHYTRNTMDISAIALLKEKTHLPIIADPSHAAGIARMVRPLALAAVAAGADGLMIEVHNNPTQALSDAEQQLTPAEFATVAQSLVVHQRTTNNHELAELRSQIDSLDTILIETLARRMQVSREIGDYKHKNNMPIVQTGRYNDVIQNRLELAEQFGLSEQLVKQIYQLIHEESVNIQLKK